MLTITRSRSTPTATAASCRLGSLAHGLAAGADHRGRPERRRPGPTWSSATPATARSRSSSAHEFVGPVQSRLAPRLPAAGDAPRRPGRLRRPGGRYDRQRPARSRGHQQADRPGEHPAEPGRRDLRARPCPIAPGPDCRRSTPAARPRSRAWRPRPAWPPGRSRRAGRPTW